MKIPVKEGTKIFLITEVSPKLLNKSLDNLLKSIQGSNIVDLSYSRNGGYYNVLITYITP